MQKLIHSVNLALSLDGSGNLCIGNGGLGGQSATAHVDVFLDFLAGGSSSVEKVTFSWGALSTLEGTGTCSKFVPDS